MRKSSLPNYPHIFRNYSLNSVINQYLLFRRRERKAMPQMLVLFSAYCQRQLWVLNCSPCFYTEASLTAPEEIVACLLRDAKSLTQHGYLSLQRQHRCVAVGRDAVESGEGAWLGCADEGLGTSRASRGMRSSKGVCAGRGGNGSLRSNCFASV